MTEHELILNAVIISLFVTPICTFFNAKFAWEEIKWFIFLYFGLLFIEKKYKVSKMRFCKAVLLHSALFIWGAFFTGYGLFFTYGCAKLLFNYAAGG